MLNDGGGGGALQRSFFDASKAAHELRRHRDHLNQNVSNLSARRGARPAMYGTLSWFTPNQEQFDLIPNGRVTAISAGNILPYDMVHKACLPVGPIYEPPVDGFVLFGFGETFYLSQTLRSLRLVLEGLSNDAEEDFKEMLRRSSDHLEFSPLPLYGSTVIFDATAQKEAANLYRYELKLVHPLNAKFER